MVDGGSRVNCTLRPHLAVVHRRSLGGTSSAGFTVILATNSFTAGQIKHTCLGVQTGYASARERGLVRAVPGDQEMSNTLTATILILDGQVFVRRSDILGVLFTLPFCTGVHNH